MASKREMLDTIPINSNGVSKPWRRKHGKSDLDVGKKPATSGKSEDLENLNHQCLQALQKIHDQSVTPAKLRQSKSFKKILKYYNLQKRNSLIRRWLPVVLLLFVVGGLLWFFRVENSTLGLALTRSFLVTVLPLWNWTSLYGPMCLFDNPFQPEVQFSDENCVICEDLRSIPEFLLGSLTSFQIGEDFLVEELPVIIRDAVNHSVKQSLHLKGLLEMHLHDDFMDPCKFRTNLKTKRAFQFRSFVEKVNRDDFNLTWFAFWEFCKLAHVKEARPVVPRPDVIPPMLEISESVWFFLASNLTAYSFKHIELSAPVFWFVQITGVSHIQLTPKSPCGTFCLNLEAILNPGDLILLTDTLFDVGWMPGNSSEVLAVAVGAR